MSHLALLGMSKFLTNEMLYRMRMSLSLCQVQLTLRKDPPPLLTVAMSDKPWLSRHTSCSHSVKNRLRSKEETDKQDRAGNFWYETKSPLSNFVIFFLRNSNNKYSFVALWCVVKDRCSSSVQAACELIISSSLLVIACNKYELTSERYIVSKAERRQYTPFFKLKSTNVSLLSSLVWFVYRTKMADSALWLVRSPVNQTHCEGSIVHF